MRRKITFESDVAVLIEKCMQERGLSFKQAVNSAIREGLEGKGRPFETPTFRMGFNPTIPLDKASTLTGELEDDALVRNLAARK